MPEFIARSARYDLQATISFQTASRVHDGYSVNVSESGMLAKFFEPLTIWEMGELQIELDGELLTLRARVAREEGGCYGLAFQIRNAADQLAIRFLVEQAGGIY